MKKDLLNYILTLLIVFLCAFVCKAKDITISHFYEQTENYDILKRDTSLLISVQFPKVTIGNTSLLAVKRVVWYSVQEYIVYDEYILKNGKKLTLNIDPDSGETLQVDYKNYYFRP